MHVERVPLILRDGTAVLLRRTQPRDEALLRAFRDSIAGSARAGGPLRFHAQTDDDLETLSDSSDPGQLLTLIALRVRDGEERVIAVAAYVRGQDRAAEIVLGVEPEFRGLGLARGLLTRLGVLAAHHDVVRFEVCAETADARLLDVLEKSAFPRLEDVGPGLVAFDLANASGPSGGLPEVRDRVATTASLHPFFHPNSVAVVGASRDPKSLGYRTLHALVVGRFDGPVYAVNPSARSVGPFPAYDSVGALPERIDLAVILVPQRHVLSVVDDCARQGVRALVVITAGFAEVDDAGRELQDKLLAKVRGHGMRMVGPNCMGLLNLDPEVRLSATFASVTPPAGGVAMSSQSGALGLAVLAAAERLGIGFSSFVSVGNKADVSSNDLLQYWEDDPHTRVILLYVESFGNPRRFARIARRVGQRKPIVAVKSGRTHAGTRAAGSHTAALASNDRAVDALFRQTGVIRADTMEEMFDLSLLLSSQPLPRGPRVAILTNAGGPAILCADALEARGLEVAELGRGVRDALLEFLPPEASVANPVDMIASATPEGYQRAAELLLRSDEVDALVAIYAPIEAADLAPVEAALQRAIHAAAQEKPVLTVLMGDEGRGVTRGMRDGVPSYAFPEAAARVLATAYGYGVWKRKPQGNPVTTEGLDLEAARAICKRALAERGSGWLSHDEVVAVLRAAGLPELLGAIAYSADEAVAHAAAAEGPVALKLISRTLVHKTDVGGVLLGLEDESEVRAAYARMQDRLAADGHADAVEGVLVQPMVSGGVEVMAGMTVDPVFGPIVAFGLGGIMVEVLEDVAFRLTPLSQEDAQEMLTSIRGRALLDGFRGSPVVDKDALVQILLRISQLSDRIPEIDDLDLNPIFIGAVGQGARVVDVRIHVTPV